MWADLTILLLINCNPPDLLDFNLEMAPGISLSVILKFSEFNFQYDLYIIFLVPFILVLRAEIGFCLFQIIFLDEKADKQVISSHYHKKCQKTLWAFLLLSGVSML